MEWQEEGILLTLRRHGESGAIVEAFTPSHGRHAGLVRGGASRRMAPILQPGAQLQFSWRARLEDQLGHFSVDVVRSRSDVTLGGDRLALAGLNAVTALLSFCLPEREAHPRLYRDSERLLDLLGQGELWPLAYLRWEIALLEDMGYGLDLSACAVTGATEGLAYVSPRTGRAVTRAGAGDYADRLLPLPPVLKGEGQAGDAEIAEALTVTGHFLHNHLAPELGSKPLPDARARLMQVIARRLARPTAP
ncbi:DNA repair protein RecO [Pseudooceanicola sp. CBS1P-1]|uniref:DNA repair protein RecO n=1 Tax=Pseudooceanicola albus TaxID=2692189 RepID=A0A6L7G870_9RHOB|nr:MULTISPECIES: DNA repair protein RecO [Pseudooceanicola]MBT9384058.1 DNA repair protein RecO [Pseudooceanicola endophyticus]MXN19842.1 DNA repair protein RecO [Pseudooceanicola albus]